MKSKNLNRKYYGWPPPPSLDSISYFVISVASVAKYFFATLRLCVKLFFVCDLDMNLTIRKFSRRPRYIEIMGLRMNRVAFVISLLNSTDFLDQAEIKDEMDQYWPPSPRCRTTKYVDIHHAICDIKRAGFQIEKRNQGYRLTAESFQAVRAQYQKQKPSGKFFI